MARAETWGSVTLLHLLVTPLRGVTQPVALRATSPGTG